MYNVFDLLDDRIKSIIVGLNPTEIQSNSIPLILDGKNVLLISPTGTGKTEAAILPIFHKFLNEREQNKEKDNNNGIFAIYITPLRALNRDILKRLEEWGEHLGIKVRVRHGDTPESERRRQIINPPDILITTPETFQLLFLGKKLKKLLPTVRFVVLDEIHELVSSKRGTQLSIALERLEEICNNKIQRIGLSATIKNKEDVGKFLAGSDRPCEIIDVQSDKSLDIGVSTCIPTEDDDIEAKELSIDPELFVCLKKIKNIAEKSTSMLIFVNTRQVAEIIGSRLKMLGLSCEVHHGSLSKDVRISIEESFKNGDIKALVCTSSMELGIDIGSIENVIQYSSPRRVNRLLQRVGRAGHSIHEVSSGLIIATFPDDIIESWVITRRGLFKELEDVDIIENSYDVLANQIYSSLIGEKTIDAIGFFNMVKKAYPYRNLDKEQFFRLLKEMNNLGLIFLESKYDLKSDFISGSDRSDNNILIKPRRRIYRHYYENISMIPDEKKFYVVDFVSRNNIGTLDESFVASFLREGSTFIMKGELWRIVSLKDGAIEVVPAANTDGNVPNWSGEEIPVPFDVAREVGEVRRLFATYINKEDDSGRINLIERLSGIGYPIEEESYLKVKSLLEYQSKDVIPTDMVITIESEGNTAVINLCAGHKVNETIGTGLSALLSARLGVNISMGIDPYRIKLEFPSHIPLDLIYETVIDIDPSYLEGIVKLSLKNTSILKWKIIVVAKRMGALSKEFNFDKISSKKLLQLFEDSLIYEEAVNEVFFDRMDFKNSKLILDKVKNGEIKVLTIPRLTPLSSEKYFSFRSMIASDNMDSLVIKRVKERIMDDYVVLFCLNCLKWSRKMRVKSVQDEIICPICGAKLIAALKPWDEDKIKLIKKIKKDGKPVFDEKEIARIYRNANLVLSYGKKAVIALAAHGIGPNTAVKILSRSDTEEKFYKYILESERDFARTRTFWN